MFSNIASVSRLQLQPLSLLRRGKCACALVPSQSTNHGRDLEVSSINRTPLRSYSYYRSKVEESPEKYTAYEKSYGEWKFVEKLMPPTHVAPPPTDDPNIVFPSGWKAPSPPKDCPYLIRRTKNHMLPIYVIIMDRGQVRYTHIRRVEGNVWQLEKDIGEYLQKLIPNKTIITRTHEINRQVIIKGDLVDHVKNWALEQGF